MKISDRSQSLNVSSGIIFIILGSVFLIIAVIGAAMPLIPTVPFLLLSLWFFARSSVTLSKKIENSFLRRKYGGSFNFREGIKFEDKLRILLPVLGLLCFLFVLSDSMIVRSVIVLAALIKTTVFIMIKTRH